MAARTNGAVRLLAALIGAIALLGIGAQAAAASSEVVYNSIPSPLPGNVPSYGMEAYSMSQFGADVALPQPSGAKKPVVNVLMSSWACEQGNWVEANCTDPKPGKSFHWPVTLTLNSAGHIFTQTKKAKVPYRPPSSPVCAGPEFNSPGSWYDAAENKCYHGIAFTVKFSFAKPDFVSNNTRLLVSYNTSHHGPAPVGESACNATSAGCVYDSLNVGVTGPGAVTVGSNPEQDVIVNSAWDEMYCGDSAAVNTLQFVDCPSFYEEERPAFKVEASKR
jgi:hypothetical protein